MKTAVLLIDCDLGFIFWLGRALDQAGYEALPAKSVPDAVELMEQLQLSVGLVVLDYSLPGAVNFIASLRLHQKCAKIMGLVEEPNVPMYPGVDSQICKPADNDDVSKMELLHEIQQALALEPAPQWRMSAS